ncbi:MAG: Sodium-dependent phosphate transporter, partial [uncultured Ramlibacter sp.]
DRHRGQEDQEGPQLLRRRDGRDLRVARPPDRQPATGHERVPQRFGAGCAEAAGREGALPRPGARLRLHPPQPFERQRGAEHRDQFAAHRPDQRPQADQFAHLLDRLPDPGVGRCARAQPPAQRRAGKDL